MPRSDTAGLIERAKRVLLVDGRFISMGGQFRIWDRGPDGGPRPAELLPEIYGGVYDRVTARYVAPPVKVHEFPITRAQGPFITSRDPGIIREMLLGAPGAGKTFGLGAVATRLALEFPNRTGGAVGATNDRRQILWDHLLGLWLPLGWVSEAPERDKQITLHNGVVVDVLAATPPSKQIGSPLQGYSWSWAVVDEHQSIGKESHQEIDARGRRAGKTYRVYSSATNQTQIPNFRVELERFKTKKNHRLHRVSGFDNPFVERSFYEELRSRYSARDYAAIIEGKDVPPEAMVYFQFAYENNVRPRPVHGQDITRKLTKKLLGKAYDFIGAQDFGVVVHATEVLRAFECPDSGEALWWVVDEIVSVREMTSTHARKIIGRYSTDSIVLIADPHLNTKDVDKSDYNQVRNEGLDIVRAKEGKIPREARVSMVNALLLDADRKSRLFIDVDAHGAPRAPQLLQAFLSEERQPNGDIEGRKDLAHDWSHYPSALGYGLWKFERLRAKAADAIKSITLC